MGTRYYPTVKLRVEDVPEYEFAESVLENVAEHESMNEKNHESKYQREKHNGTTKITGYIKLSLETDSDIDIFANFSCSDGDINIISQGSRKESIDEFRKTLDVFEETIYPTVTEIFDEDKVRMNVTTRGV